MWILLDRDWKYCNISDVFLVVKFYYLYHEESLCALIAIEYFSNVLHDLVLFKKGLKLKLIYSYLQTAVTYI